MKVRRKEGSKTLYQLLGVSAEASQQEIRKLYWERWMQHHPDQGGDNSEEFKEASRAYATLRHPGKRAAYDKTLKGTTKCTECNGTGTVEVFKGFKKLRAVKCKSCNGEGRV